MLCYARQNLGCAASGARLQLVVVINGFDVIVDAPPGQMVLFQGRAHRAWESPAYPPVDLRAERATRDPSELFAGGSLT